MKKWTSTLRGGGGVYRIPSHLNTDQLLEKSISHHENDFTGVTDYYFILLM